MDFCVAATRVIAGGQVLAPGFARIHGGTVSDVGAGIPADADIVLDTGVLAPGLVDLQLNGAFGVDLVEAGPSQWAEVVAKLPATGCTAFAPSYITAPVDTLVEGIERYRSVRETLEETAGAARTLGVHLEGPFLSARRRGAHRLDDLTDPSEQHMDALLAAGADGALAYVTLAPERHGALDAIRRLRDAGVRVAVGHSDATEDVVRAAADAGATIITHLFNAQRPFNHRDPGVVGAGLTDERFTLGLIADLHHATPTAVRLAFAAAAGRIALVTDAVSALGMPEGQYVLGREVVHLEQGRPPLRTDGTIGGSALAIDEAVANAVACGVDPVTAVDAASRVPADALGRTDIGRIAPGAAADLVWLSDDMRTRATWIAGVLAHACPDATATLGVTSDLEVIR